MWGAFSHDRRYGSAPDIGAEEYYQELTAPGNVTTTVSGGNFYIGWSSVPGYSYYKVYASDNPYGTFTEIYHTSNLSFTTAVTSTKRFYYVIATTEAPSKFYESEEVVSAKSDPETDQEGRAVNRKHIRMQKLNF